jgi:integration host factor subunit beta
LISSLFGIRHSREGGVGRGDKVEIRGFGSFRTRQHRARIGRNPKTGIPVNVPAKAISYFTPSKELQSRTEGIRLAQEQRP